MKTTMKTLVWLLGPIVIAQGMGCASSYNRYSECQVNCQYCEPAPLPYPQYESCVCHSMAASRYLARVPSFEDRASPPIVVVATEDLSGDREASFNRDETLSRTIEPISQLTPESSQ